MVISWCQEFVVVYTYISIEAASFMAVIVYKLSSLQQVRLNHAAHGKFWEERNEVVCAEVLI